VNYAEALQVLRVKTDWDKWLPEELDAWDFLGTLHMVNWQRAPKGDADGVVIVGKAGGHNVAPWLEPGWEFWGLNEQFSGTFGSPPLLLYDRWFQLHPPAYLERHYRRGLDDLNLLWSRKWGIPCYLDRVYPGIPDSVAFPKAEVEALTPLGWYHASSMDWMLAFAIHEGFKKIILAGISVSTYPVTDREPLSARAALEYWAGVAHGRGIELEVLGPKGHLFEILHMAVHRSKLQYGFAPEPGHDLAAETNWEDHR